MVEESALTVRGGDPQEETGNQGKRHQLGWCQHPLSQPHHELKNTQEQKRQHEWKKATKNREGRKKRRRKTVSFCTFDLSTVDVPCQLDVPAPARTRSSVCMSGLTEKEIPG